jgi:glutamyl-tRNA synthetase
MVATRFAPSPTGLLHIGNARAAVWNRLYALRHGGTFLLRLDDTDVERSRPEFAEAIVEDLAWLGIVPDRTFRQSDRLSRYTAALDALRARGAVYPCYETAEELDRQRRLRKLSGLPPVYDRAALALTDADRARLEAEGRRPHWRFRLSGEEARWSDGVRGASAIATASLSDPVLVRADGTVLYTLASVVDDAETGVTDIIRGEDHVTNTAVQIELFRALGADVPRFAHQNLLVAASGEEMSKRTGALSLRAFREAGAEGLAVAAVAAFAGTAESPRAFDSLAEMAPLADLGIVSRAPARFDETEIMHLSARLVHRLPPSAAADRLGRLDLPHGVFEAFWLAVRGNLARVEEARHWRDVVFGPLSGRIEDETFARQAAGLLPEGPPDATTFRSWAEAVGAATGRRGKALFRPLRLALTGEESGPELGPLLPLMGREKVLARLRGQRA